MEAIQKQSNICIQHKIRSHAEEVKNSINDLYNWEKEMKDKELKLRTEREQINECFQPIRSHIAMDGIEVKEDMKSEYKVEAAPVENNQKTADLFKELGNKHVKLGEYEKAITEYTTAINAFDQNPKFYTNRALCYLKLKRYDECIEDCNRAIEIDSLTVKAYYRRMQAKEYLGMNVEALEDCSTVLMIDPGNIDAKHSLQRINQKLRKSGTNINEGPNFSPLRSNLVDIFPFEKPSYSRSKKPLKKVAVIDVIGSKDSKNFENSNIQISDEVIEKLFNGECGSYEEVKKSSITDKVKVDESEPDYTRVTSTKCVVQASELEFVNRNRTLPEAPKSTAQFYCNWKELTLDMKYLYIKSIPISQLNKILGAGFDSETLSDLLKILKEFYVQNKDNVCEVLLHISKNNRLSILSLLLSSDDKAALTAILNYITCGNYNVAHVKTIKKSFNLE